VQLGPIQNPTAIGIIFFLKKKKNERKLKPKITQENKCDAVSQITLRLIGESSSSSSWIEARTCAIATELSGLRKVSQNGD
jgi:hypothetical protein